LEHSQKLWDLHLLLHLVLLVLLVLLAVFFHQVLLVLLVVVPFFHQVLLLLVVVFLVSVLYHFPFLRKVCCRHPRRHPRRHRRRIMMVVVAPLRIPRP